MSNSNEAIRVDFNWYTHEQKYTDDMKLTSGFVTAIKRYIGYGIKEVYDAPVSVLSVERVGPYQMEATVILREDPGVSPNRIEDRITEGVTKGFNRLIDRKWDNEELLNFVPYHDEDGMDAAYGGEIEIDDVEYVPEYYGQQRLFATEERIAMAALGLEYPELSHHIHTVLASTDREERGDAHESPRLRCLVDVRRDARDDCPEYEGHPTYKRKRYENE